MKWYDYLLGPGAWFRNLQGKIDKFVGGYAQQTEHGEPVESYRNTNIDRNVKSGGIGEFLNGVWDDLTGKSQIELQNKLDREMAEEEYQRNLEAIGDTKAAYEAAGFNPNLMYGSASQASYEAPKLQAYSGSAKLDSILSRTGKVLGMIPAIYQATAALEGIDQAREKTKQNEIRTMSMGMSLLDQGYRLGKNYFSLPFSPELYTSMISNKRHFTGVTSEEFRPAVHNDRVSEYSRYADASLRNTFDLLSSIGIKNQMNSTLNNWRGYQYSLDRKYGAAGRIVGMASQGIGAASKFLPLNSFFRR